MSLKLYRQKRDFKKTPEPKGKTVKQTEKNSYLIQKHAASHLHYDFRIELDGVLKSWAVPKGPCLDPDVKRLAVHVEDHPLEYGSFEGIIPAGEYGGGTVMLWDQGHWISQDDNPMEAYRKGSMTFQLQGKRLKGLWKLIRIKTDPKNWLLIKIEDKYAKPLADVDITEKYKKSAVSGITMDQIAKEDNVYSAKKSKQSSKTKKKVLEKGKESSFPSHIHPQLATLVDKPPIGDQWLHEIKLDGYRIIAFIKNKSIKLLTRNQNDWTEKFPHLVKELKKLNFKSAILDGELTALDDSQQTDFQLLQNSIHTHDTSSLVYYAFDLLYYNGKSLEGLPLLERKEILQSILPTNEKTIRYSDHIIGHGTEVWRNACELHLEGIVSKNVYGTYIQSRTRDWLKIKCIKQQEFIIGGFTKPKGARQSFGSLLIGTYDKSGKLNYAGHVGTGFNEESLAQMAALLKKYPASASPFLQKPPGIKHITWVQPKIIIEVAFSEWTKEGILRHPSFKGVRKDKPPKQVIRETPDRVNHHSEEITMKSEFSVLTNPDKVLYKDQGITKLDLAEYYNTISDWILPYVKNRPLTLVRCPNGDHSKCFFQKHLDSSSMTSLYPIPIKEKHKKEVYAYLKNKKGLIALVQLGVLEIHTWNCLVDRIESPDMIIFDIDPSPEIDWSEVIATAKHIRSELKKIKLESFVKTTGGKGLHVVVPIKRLYSWDEVKIFSHTFVDYLVSLKPDLYIGVMSKAKRKNKIFIDYLRNQRGATSVTPYSTRAKDGAPVSVPLAWEELSTRIKSDSFNIFNLPARLEKLKKDPWEGFLTLHQKLPITK